MSNTPVPFRTSEARVPPDWIDYNGHMNVAYYTMAFDRAVDEFYDRLGIGPGLVVTHKMGPMALQSQIHYLGELLEGARFACDVRLLDADAKRVHVFVELLALDRDGAVAATCESLSINVDLETRRSTPYPPDAEARIAEVRAAHRDLPTPPQVGAPLGIRRRAGAT